MDKDKFEQIHIPECLSETVRNGIAEGEKIYRKNKRKKFWVKVGSCAAVVLIFIGIFATQPVLASKVPVVRDIFKLFREDYSYQGDLDEVAEKLEEPEGEKWKQGSSSTEVKSEKTSVEDSRKDTGETETVRGGRYTKTVNGVTATLSEVYCSGEAIYISMMFTRKDGFPDTMEYDGKPSICVKTSERQQFTAEDNPGFGFGYLEGDFLDSNTYAGIYRIDMKDIAGGEEKEQLLLAGKINLDFTIEQIIGEKAEPDKPDMQGKTEEELEAMTDEEWEAFMKEVYSGEWSQFPNMHEHWWYDGPFEFELDLTVDEKNLEYVIVDEINENGAGLYSVSKSKFEIAVEEKNSEEREKQGTFLVVLDADAIVLPSGSSSYVNTYAVNGRDVSTVYVYICDYQEYMDELKGYRNKDNFKEILEEYALYSKEIRFEK